MATRVYRDLDLSFLPNPVTGDITKLIGDAAVTRSVLNLLELNHFEIPFHPDIGSNIQHLLFEQLTTLTANALEKEINNTITNFEPRFTVYQTIVTPLYDQNGFQVVVTGFINNNPSPVQISAFLERIM